MEMVLPFSSFILDRTAVMGVYMKSALPFSNGNGFTIFMLYARPQGGHWRLA
jgi:hypothetical protein